MSGHWEYDPEMREIMERWEDLPPGSEPTVAEVFKVARALAFRVQELERALEAHESDYYHNRRGY